MTGKLSLDYAYSYYVLYRRVVKRKRHNKKREYIGLETQISSTVINSSIPLSVMDIEAFVRKVNTRAVSVEILNVDEVRR